MAWNSAAHPRVPAGGPAGGQFGAAAAKKQQQQKAAAKKKTTAKRQPVTLASIAVKRKRGAKLTPHEKHLWHVAHMKHMKHTGAKPKAAVAKRGVKTARKPAAKRTGRKAAPSAGAGRRFAR